MTSFSIEDEHGILPYPGAVPAPYEAFTPAPPPPVVNTDKSQAQQALEAHEVSSPPALNEYMHVEV